MSVFTDTEVNHLLEVVSSAINLAKRQPIDGVEVALNSEMGFSVTARGGDVESVEHNQEKSLTVTIYQDYRTGSASTSDLSLEAITTTIEKARSIAHFAGQDKFSGLPNQELLAYQYPNLDLYHPWNISPSEAIPMAIECESIARDQDKRIIPADGSTVTSHNYYKIYANSHGFLGHYPVSEHSISCSVVAQEGQHMQRDFEYTAARKPEMLDDLAHVAKHAAHKALHHLGSRKIKTQSCPVIFHARMAKGLMSSFIGAISGRNIYRESSFLMNCIDKKVFPEHINIYQQPHLLCALGSAPFDSEGVKTADRFYIKDGKLVSYVLGSYSSRKLGLTTTGNAGGTYNLSISTGHLHLLEMMKQMNKGLLITELMGNGANMLTGDYSRGASGFWIENGEIQFPVEEITIAGNLKDMFLNIAEIGNDVDHRGNIRTGSILINKMTIAGE